MRWDMEIQEMKYGPMGKNTLMGQKRGTDRFYFCSGCGYHVSTDLSCKEQDMIRDKALRMMFRSFHKLHTT
jgi:hypothetical protein